MAITQFQHNDEMYQWERVDRVQTYRGIKIETLTSHADGGTHPQNHREYRVTWPDGHTSYFPINKRPGGNISDLKTYIDHKLNQ